MIHAGGRVLHLCRNLADLCCYLLGNRYFVKLPTNGAVQYQADDQTNDASFSSTFPSGQVSLRLNVSGYSFSGNQFHAELQIWEGLVIE